MLYLIVLKGDIKIASCEILTFMMETVRYYSECD
jgi:hypothetical protein